MDIITDPAALARALDSPLPPAVRRLLSQRADLIDIATFVSIEAGDKLADAEAAAGIPLTGNMIDGARWGELDFEPSFEWALDHGGVFELPYILSDNGSVVVLIVPDDDRIDAALLSMARHYAEPAEAIAPTSDTSADPTPP